MKVISDNSKMEVVLGEKQLFKAVTLLKQSRWSLCIEDSVLVFLLKNAAICIGF